MDLKIKLISSRFDILLVNHNEHYEIEESINIKSANLITLIYKSL